MAPFAAAPRPANLGVLLPPTLAAALAAAVAAAALGVPGSPTFPRAMAVPLVVAVSDLAMLICGMLAPAFRYFLPSSA